MNDVIRKLALPALAVLVSWLAVLGFICLSFVAGRVVSSYLSAP